MLDSISTKLQRCFSKDFFAAVPILQIVFYSQSMPKSLTFKVNIIHSGTSRDNTSTNLIRFHTFSNLVFFPFSTIWSILKTAVGPTEDKCSDRRGSPFLSQENVIEKNMRFVVDCEQKFIQVLPGVPDAQHQNVIWKLKSKFKKKITEMLFHQMLNSMFLNPLSKVLPPFPSNRFCYLYLKIEIKRVSNFF